MLERGVWPSGWHTSLLALAVTAVALTPLDDTVSVNVERKLNLRYPTACSWNASQLELAKRLIVGSHLAFALQYVNRYRRLSVGRR